MSLPLRFAFGSSFSFAAGVPYTPLHLLCEPPPNVRCTQLEQKMLCYEVMMVAETGELSPERVALSCSEARDGGDEPGVIGNHANFAMYF